MSTTMSKQDKQGARTPADLQYRYGTSFADAIGIARDARSTAEEAKATAESVDKDLDQEEIFKRLTNNGEVQGMFRDEDGQIYINAAYIVSLGALFAKDITMTGKFTNTVETYILPSNAEMELMQAHVLGQITIPSELIPLYDFSGDGTITSVDLRIARTYQLGTADFSAWSGAKKSTVTLTIDLTNPDKAIQITGTNMWGRAIDCYYGCNFTSIINPDTEAKIDALEERVKALENSLL